MNLLKYAFDLSIAHLLFSMIYHLILVRPVSFLFKNKRHNIIDLIVKTIGSFFLVTITSLITIITITEANLKPSTMFVYIIIGGYVLRSSIDFIVFNYFEENYIGFLSFNKISITNRRIIILILSILMYAFILFFNPFMSVNYISEQLLEIISKGLVNKIFRWILIVLGVSYLLHMIKNEWMLFVTALTKIEITWFNRNKR